MAHTLPAPTKAFKFFDTSLLDDLTLTFEFTSCGKIRRYEERKMVCYSTSYRQSARRRRIRTMLARPKAADTHENEAHGSCGSSNFRSDTAAHWPTRGMTATASTAECIRVRTNGLLCMPTLKCLRLQLHDLNSHALRSVFQIPSHAEPRGIVTGTIHVFMRRRRPAVIDGRVEIGDSAWTYQRFALLHLSGTSTR